MDERRKFPRMAVDVEVRWSRIKGRCSGEGSNTDVTKDMSEGGICLVSDEPLVKGEKLSLEFTLPTGKRISVTGRTVWVESFEIISGKDEDRHYDAGIEFLDISEDDRSQIQKFVFSILKR